MKEKSNLDLKLIIADDHLLFRKGVISTLKNTRFISVIREASSGTEVLDILSKEKIDLILMDISMPNMDGDTATRIIRKKHPLVKIIALTMNDSEKIILEMYKSGAHSYLLKNTDRRELETAIRDTIAGKVYNSERVKDILLPKLIDTNLREQSSKEADKLTNREIEVLQLICKELTSEEIARKLFLSKRTIEAHRFNLFRKTNSKNMIGILKYAQQNGMI